MKKTTILYFLLAFSLIAIVIESFLLLRCRYEVKIENDTPQSIENSIIGNFNKLKGFSEGYTLNKGLEPKKGFIPNYKTAIKYAELLWLPIFGKKVYDEKPFNATLVGDSLWVISGTLPSKDVGGTVEAIFQKSDGKILRIVHQK